VGSFFGLVALLLGALFNAELNRRRDDRLRTEEQRAVATALKAELEELRRTLNDAAETISQEGYLQPDEQVQVPDLVQSIRIMPGIVSKLGLLDETIISAVLDAYGLVEQYSAKLVLLGGRPGVTPRQLHALCGVASKSTGASCSTEHRHCRGNPEGNSPTGYHQKMARDVMARAMAVAAHHRVTPSGGHG
jgi:hypothetical protein